MGSSHSKMTTLEGNSDSLPTVVRIRRCRGRVVQGCDVYIGDAVKRGGWDLPDSEWRNPYIYETTKNYLADLQRYEMYLRTERPDLMARLPELYGKTLGCWCKPGPCHGDVLEYLVKEHIAANSTVGPTCDDVARHRNNGTQMEQTNDAVGYRDIGTQTDQTNTCGYKRLIDTSDPVEDAKFKKFASI